ncbi:hypothetical protein HPB52_019034 [Rhipicephalus sanguineus]|uniref:Ubiquitin-conjugating enzyme E2 Z n=1 Tax=Rhipicephalus sanguineus TaxID=34632 RepID=A0A9D4T044_RHISA|nr:hypothetical protein HPB52_019034 [Rhipicephalus sanguineus]
MKLPQEDLDALNADSFEDQTQNPLAAAFARGSDTARGSSDIDDATTGHHNSEMDYETVVSRDEFLDDECGDPLVAEYPLPSGAASCSRENVGNLSVFPLEQWNPVNFEHEGTSPQCLLRCKRDIMNLITDPPPGVYIAPQEGDITRIHALVVGPPDTLYDGGFFHYLIQCPPDYPIRPPRVRLMNTDGGRVRFHPNLFESGQVCLNILGTSDWSGVPVEWSPAMSIASVLVSLQSLVAEIPHWSTEQDACEFSCLMAQHEMIRVAVCDAIEGCINGTSLCPPPLRAVMMRSFLDNIEEYMNGGGVQREPDRYSNAILPTRQRTGSLPIRSFGNETPDTGNRSTGFAEG